MSHVCHRVSQTCCTRHKADLRLCCRGHRDRSLEFDGAAIRPKGACLQQGQAYFVPFHSLVQKVRKLSTFPAPFQTLSMSSHVRILIAVLRRPTVHRWSPSARAHSVALARQHAYRLVQQNNCQGIHCPFSFLYRYSKQILSAVLRLSQNRTYSCRLHRLYLKLNALLSNPA